MISAPSVGVAGTARGFHYGTYAAETLDFTFTGSRPRGGAWTGRTTLAGTGLQMGTFALQALTATADLRPGATTFSFSARRDPNTDLTAAGTLQMDGLSPTGAIVDAMALRIGGTEWRLQQRARVGWAAEQGIAVENLVLRRTGPAGATGV